MYLNNSRRFEKFRVGIIEDLAAAQKRLAQGDKDDNRIQKGGTPSYNVMNIYGGFENKKIALQAYLNNIFNEDYRTHGSGINGIGRSLSLLFTVKIGR